MPTNKILTEGNISKNVNDIDVNSSNLRFYLEYLRDSRENVS